MAKDVISRTSADTPRQRLLEPLSWLRMEFDRLFDDLSFRNFDPSLWQSRTRLPALEMEATDKGYKLTAELPGLSPEDVDIDVTEGVLTISGEKKEVREEKDKGFMFTERSYGRFERRVQLPAGADEDNIEARFENGILTIDIGKNDKSEKRKRISINKE